ncbi:MAG: hypothetical protein JKY89_00295 [Immundisolibacteraceae bacterium]|nr:hypothetical protein [Immundisolibacteraceae bacterium]
MRYLWILLILSQTIIASNLKTGWNLWTSTIALPVTSFFSLYPSTKIIWRYEDGIWKVKAQSQNDSDLISPLYPELFNIEKNVNYWIKLDSITNLPVSTIGASFTNFSTSCNTILQEGASIGDGFYWIQPINISVPIKVYCNMSYKGGGWTVIDSATSSLIRTENILFKGDQGSFSQSYTPVNKFNLGSNTIVEFDFGIKFTEYMMSFQINGVNSSDTYGYTNEEFLQNTNNIGSINPSNILTVYETVNIRSIIAGHYETGIDNSTLAIGTNLKVHSIKSGGQFGSNFGYKGSYFGTSDKSIKFDTIFKDHFIQSVSLTSKIRIKYISDRLINGDFSSTTSLNFIEFLNPIFYFR